MGAQKQTTGTPANKKGAKSNDINVHIDLNPADLPSAPKSLGLWVPVCSTR